ncbi:CCA tRNA nucleotidyltransferase 1 [Mactra antiquata]
MLGIGVQRLHYIPIISSIGLKLTDTHICSFKNSLPALHYLLYSSSSINCPTRRRGLLKKMKLDTPEFHALFSPELKELKALFDKNDYEMRIAGGAVRDLLMGITSHDIDFATTATPDQMKEMFELAGVRMIHAKGESHGTITARINDKENFEVTTLRIDVVTDGRRAEVEFTKDWQLDANRRDLTINAMFLGFDGTVYDYFNGIEDIKNRRVKFVGDPIQRIQEDYLRILRYFRFYGRIAQGPNEHDEETLKAIKDNSSGLERVSGERIWTELKRIVVGNYAGPIIETMVGTGVSKYMGLPEECNVEEFQRICKVTEGFNPEPMARIAALLDSEQQVYELQKRLKVSNDELKTCLFIVKYRDSEEGDDLCTYYKHLIARLSGKEKTTRTKVLELLKYKGYNDLREEILAWTLPQLPVNGKDLIIGGVKKGPVFAKTLDRLRIRWIESDFKLTREELLEMVDEVLKEIRG